MNFYKPIKPIQFIISYLVLYLPQREREVEREKEREREGERNRERGIERNRERRRERDNETHTHTHTHISSPIILPSQKVEENEAKGSACRLIYLKDYVCFIFFLIHNYVLWFKVITEFVVVSRVDKSNSRRF